MGSEMCIRDRHSAGALLWPALVCLIHLSYIVLVRFNSDIKKSSRVPITSTDDVSVRDFHESIRNNSVYKDNQIAAWRSGGIVEQQYTDDSIEEACTQLAAGSVLYIEQCTSNALYSLLAAAVFKNDDRGRTTLVICLLYTSPSPRDATLSRMPSSA